MPKRSMFYNLQPIGVGTPYVESLTSYISRLAYAHNMNPGLLISNYLAPTLKKEYLMNGKTGVRFYKKSHYLNSIGDNAKEFVDVLSQMTGVLELRSLTMLPWARVIPGLGLMKENRAWCPDCYNEWHEKGETLYEPLLWTLEEAKVCPIHRKPLITNCVNGNCSDALPVLVRRSKPGYCPRCEAFLGRVMPKNSNKDINQEYYFWVSLQLGNLLAKGAYTTLEPKDVNGTIKDCVNSYFGGNITEFARAVDITKTTVWGWYNRKCMPSITHLLKVCYLLSIEIVNFLEGRVEDQTLEKQFGDLKSKPNNKRTSRPFDEVMVRSLMEVAEHEYPPPSLEAVARGIEVDKKLLYRHYPDLCKEISSRFLNHIRTTADLRLERQLLDVKNIILSTHEKGIYPSKRFVQSEASKQGIYWRKEMSIAWRDTLVEMELL